MSRRIILLSTASIAIVIAISIILGVLLSPSIEPISKEDATFTKPTVTDGVEEDEHYDYETTEPTTIQGKEVTPEDIVKKYITLAEKAAVEYVSQNTKESGDERTKRLLTAFHGDSNVFYDSPPNVNKSDSTSTYSKPSILYNEWDIVGDKIIATISMRVDTFKNGTNDRVSRIYQVYDVVLTEQDGVYKASDISFSNKPVVI